MEHKWKNDRLSMKKTVRSVHAQVFYFYYNQEKKMKLDLKISALLALVFLVGCNKNSDQETPHISPVQGGYELVINKLEPLPIGFVGKPSVELVSTETGVIQEVTEQVSFSSSDPSVVQIEQGTVLAKKAGQVNIIATLIQAQQTLTTVAPLKVTDISVENLTLHATKGELGIGATQQYTAIAEFSDGSTLDVTEQPKDSENRLCFYVKA